MSVEFTSGKGPAPGLQRMAGAAVMAMAFAVLFAQVAVSATYHYTIVDPLKGTDIATGIDTDFWEPWIGPCGNAGCETEGGYASISNDGLVLGSFNVNLGLGPTSNPKWLLVGDFRVSFYFETSPNPGGYGNRLGAYIYEMTPGCGGTLNYPDGYGGIWMGYSPPDHYFPLDYDQGAYFLFVKSGNTLTIYRNETAVSEDPADQVFFGDYLNPDGKFLFGMGTGNPNGGWLRVRDVVIETEDLVSCEGLEIPDKWNGSDLITVSPSGTGSGSVTGNGINCAWNGSTSSGTCSVTLAYNTPVNLNVSPSTGSTFSGWSGGSGSAAGCSGTGACAFNITETSGVGASFTLGRYIYLPLILRR